MAEKTPLETIQDTAITALGQVLTKGEILALKGFLVQAFDAGSAAQRELDAEFPKTDPKPRRPSAVRSVWTVR